ncbi:MAG TPA: DUF4038 domain-containing protein [Candidatus Acidoferrum sp.]|nr:DUF4038 domain-containing protein [Candidatus Acidoferrum sp.]
MKPKRVPSLLITGLILVSAGAACAGEATQFPLKPSASGRHLVDQRGTPFFYNADTPWMVFLKLTEAEADEYFETRQAQGFNAVQIIMTGFLGTTNRAGELPFAGTTNAQDFAQPNEKFFAHVDRVIENATKRGLFLAIAPAWSGCCGEGWAGKNKDGSLKPLNANGPEKSRELGRWLGKRYAKNQNIMWILGGDIDPDNARDSIRALALGLKESAPHHLLTYHASSSHSSTDVWPKENWIDVPMVYTYFRGFNKAWNKNQPDVYEVGWKEYAKSPTRPFFLGESTYEGEHSAWGSALQARKQAYWAVLSGGFGNAYGSPNWNMPKNWREVLKLPGAASLKHFRALFESREWWKLVPDSKNAFVTTGHGTMATNDLAVAALANDGSFGIVYLPSIRPLTLDLGKFAKAPVQVTWFDPRHGTFEKEGAFPNTGPLNVTRVASDDWVLVLEGANR